MKTYFYILSLLLLTTQAMGQTAPDQIIVEDLALDAESPAAFLEIKFPSAGKSLQGFMYKANGSQKHPTLILLHGYPGNERNLDLAQVMRSRGWNVIYFNYRGSWGSEGEFSFKNCVQDVVNVVQYCKANSEALEIDKENIALFGHSMGGWICLKAIQQLPDVQKGFALSTWNIPATLERIKSPKELSNFRGSGMDYGVLNAPVEEIFTPVLKDPSAFDLSLDGKRLSNKQIVMVDEHDRNQVIAAAIEQANNTFFDYQQWKTDHSFTNKRASLIKEVIKFLDQK